MFKLGDRVRYTGRSTYVSSKDDIGKLGTIVKVGPRDSQSDEPDWTGPVYEVRFDDGGWQFTVRENLEDASVPSFKTGDRVVYDGPLVSLAGKAGLFKAHRETTPGMSAKWQAADVIFDHEPAGRVRVVNIINLRQEQPMNIKQNVIDAIKALDPKPAKRSTLAKLAYELLIATASATAADARKKKAKDAAVKGGLVLAEYRPGEVTSFDDAEFTVVAKTKEPTSKLDQLVLREALNRAGLSKAKIDAAFVAATTENKPATSYEVIQK